MSHVFDQVYDAFEMLSDENNFGLITIERFVSDQISLTIGDKFHLKMKQQVLLFKAEKT